MTEWMYLKYIFLLVNVKILSENPTESLVVDYLLILSGIVGGVLLLKLMLHNRGYSALKRDHIKLDRETFPLIVELAKTISKKIGLNRPPDLYLFENKTPLVFATGIITPSIFISPKLIETMSTEEMSAVITHELYHVKRRDGLITILLQGILIFIPLVQVTLFGRYMVFENTSVIFWITASMLMLISYLVILKYFVNKKREFVCDDLTSGCLKDPLLLAQTIIKAWKIKTDIPRYSWKLKTVYIKPFLFSGKNQNSRIVRLINIKNSPKRISGKWRKFWIPVAAVLCIVFVFKYVENKDKINIIAPSLSEQTSRTPVLVKEVGNSGDFESFEIQKYDFDKIHVFESGIFFQDESIANPERVMLDSKSEFQIEIKK